MLTKPDTCQLCPLYTKATGFVKDIVVSNPEYIFIGEAPGRNEVAKDEPFIGDAGYVLKEWLMKAVPAIKISHERHRITIMNTLRCLPPEVQGRAYPRGEERVQAETHCRQYDQIADSAHTVVLFGDSPQRCYFRQELHTEDILDKQLGHELKGVMGRIGRVYERHGKRWVFAPHPAYILRQPALVEHGQASLKIAANQESMINVDYQQWDLAMRELQ